ncbi:MAG: hypothetical protein FWD77_02620 [Betaproteobacteria bacterium]|nr:hypothetical protein [Betaproteobacteria bacterium]
MASTSNRTSRPAFERRCLSRYAKVLFRNSSKSVRKAVYKAECTARGKLPLGSGK